MSVPSQTDVQAYLAAHQLEAIVEEAVNDAVLKMAKDPYRHIGEILMRHSLKHGSGGGGDRNSKRRVSIGSVPMPADVRRVSMSAEVHEQLGSKKTSFPPGAPPAQPLEKAGETLPREYKRADQVSIRPEVQEALKQFFEKLDQNHDGTVTKEEAIAFWGKNFAKVNTKSMFNEVDEDGNEEISWDEFLEFWKNVVGSGYDQDDILEEVQMMLEGGSWVDFDDGRTT